MSAQKTINERLAFMAEGIRDQLGFQWDEYEAVCRDALARIKVLEDQDTVVTVLKRIAVALEKEQPSASEQELDANRYRWLRNDARWPVSAECGTRAGEQLDALCDEGLRSARRPRKS